MPDILYGDNNARDDIEDEEFDIDDEQETLDAEEKDNSAHCDG